MTARLHLVWDYDGGIGQVNATLPYNFLESNVLEEIEQVERLLTLAGGHGVAMTFACTGFAAEPGSFPYHTPEQIRRIHAAGHEIASHAWKHEWLPFLTSEQLDRTLGRSKEALERCLEAPGAVSGFVPPFSRPMSWRRRGAVSRGDRVGGRHFPGSDLGSLLPRVRRAGYRWCRVRYRTLWDRRPGAPAKPPLRPWRRACGVLSVPQHHTGFDEPARRLLEQAVHAAQSLVLVGHPAALGRSGGESLACFRQLLEAACRERDRGRLELAPVSSALVREGEA